MLRNTTALGIRVRRFEHRWTLDRAFHRVTVDALAIDVKIGRWQGEIVNLKPEHRDCVQVAEQTGRTVKSVWTEALARAHRELLDHRPDAAPRASAS